MLSGEIAKRYGHEGLPDETVHVRLAGSAGQSFGAFLARGVWLDLIGDTNDYCGKGLSGGRIAVQPSPKFRGEPTENIITGNVALYGAIEGEAYFRGVAGERFAVRNSGAQAVVEGLGDHGCEYMTGGTIVVLGATGRNFAAGMSGGIAYVLDERGDFARYCNPAMVTLEPLLADPSRRRSSRASSGTWAESDEASLKRLIERHARYTGSAQAKKILERWSELPRASSSRCSRTSTGARSASLPPSTSACAQRRPAMGKITGFLEYERLEEPHEEPQARKKHYHEFYLRLADEDAKIQGARCMDCGIPFCMQGCPVNNIIPDFNDLVYRQDWQRAIETLHSTNNFPEFTGRICPAPCEEACVLRINEDPVGIKSIEHAIIDKAWESGWVTAAARRA